MDLPGQSTSGRRETGRIRGINEVKGPMDNRELMETTGVITRESTGVTGCYQGEGDRMDEDKYGESRKVKKGMGTTREGMRTEIAIIRGTRATTGPIRWATRSTTAEQSIYGTEGLEALRYMWKVHMQGWAI